MTPQSAINQNESARGNASQVETLFRLRTLFVQLARCYDRLPLSRVVYMTHRGGSETIKTIRQLVLFPPDEKVERLIRYLAARFTRAAPSSRTNATGADCEPIDCLYQRPKVDRSRLVLTPFGAKFGARLSLGPALCALLCSSEH
jgi:hypothetical protein